MDDLRARRWRPDGRGTGRLPRRDRARHAQARFPGDRPGRRPDHPHRGDGQGPADVPTRPIRVGQATARATGGEVRVGTTVTHIDEESVRIRPSADRDAPEEEIPTRTVLWGAGVIASSFARKVAEAAGADDRSERARPGRARPDRARASRDLRGRRCRRPAVETGSADARRRAGRHPGRLVRGQGHPAAHPGPPVGAVPLQQPRRCGGHRPAIRCHRHPVDGPVRTTGRLHGLAAVARHPHRLPDRLRQSARRARALGVVLHDARPRHAPDHRRPAAAPDRGARAAGHGAAGRTDDATGMRGTS